MTEQMVETFATLLREAEAAKEPEPTAMTLATATPNGEVSARIVLLKSFDRKGFVFHTNSESAKGRQIAANPRAALVLLWKTIRDQVQVRIEGPVERISDAESDAYFVTRPRERQLGAWASLQSEPLPSRSLLDARFAEAETRFAGLPVKRPPHWFGYRVRPRRLEFWFGVNARLHERNLHEWRDGVWHSTMLYP